MLPKRGGYKIVQEIEESADGARNTRLVRRYINININEQEDRLPLLRTSI